MILSCLFSFFFSFLICFLFYTLLAVTSSTLSKMFDDDDEDELELSLLEEHELHDSSFSY
jgi:hypothetical protein